MIYKMIPVLSNVVTEVATGTAIKTVLQVTTPAGTAIHIVAWGITFDGVSVTAAPGICSLLQLDNPATVTALAPQKFATDDMRASACVGGTSASGYNASAEGTIANARVFDSANVHPQTGFAREFSRPPRVPPSKTLRLRVTFAADINCIPWIEFDE